MKRVVIVIPIVILGLFLTNIFYVNGKHKSKNIQIKKTVKCNKWKPMKTVSTIVDFTNAYNNIDDMIKDSDIIIQGTVLSVSYFTEGSKGLIPSTKSKVKVTKSYNKDIHEGDVLTFTEMGGVTTQKKVIGQLRKGTGNDEFKNNDTTPIKSLVNGADVMSPNQKVMLFAKVSNSKKEKAYSPLCSFEGKFLINNDGTIERVKSDDRGLTNLKFTQAEMDEKLKTFTDYERIR